MKKQINKLVELAKEMVNKAKELNFPKTHNYLQQKKDDQIEIRVYVNDNYKVWSCYFGDVEVTGYLNGIRIPFTADAKYLNSIIEKVIEFNSLYPWQDKLKERNEYRLQQIANLEKQIEKLKKQ